MDFLKDPKFLLYDKHEVIVEKDGEKVKESINGIKSNFFSYTASMGPAVIQSGLVKTLKYYEKPEADRSRIINILKHILIKFLTLEDKYSENEQTLYSLYLEKTRDKPFRAKILWRNLILESLTALKLCMDTFHKIKDEKAGGL